MKIFYFPAFMYGKKHGGYKRTKQIYDKLLSENEELVVVNFEYSKHKTNLSFLFLTFIRFISDFSFRYGIKSNLKLSASAIFLEQIFKDEDLNEIHVVLEQAPGWTLYHSKFIVDNKLPYDLYPHNIEFCVAGQSFIDDGLHYEIIKNSMIGANSIYTISSLDLLISKIFNKNSRLFRYSNFGDDFYKEVKRARKQKSSSSGRMLILASVGNPPSRKGVEELLSKINSDSEFLNSERFDVAGFDTEQLSSFQSERINVLGGLDSNELAEKLINTKAVVINQHPTTGWLTRISDMLDCGVPIYISDDYFQAVFEYKNSADFTFFKI